MGHIIEDRKTDRRVEGSDFHVRVQRPNARKAHTHLCAIALAAEVGARGSDGLRGGAAVDLRVG